MSRESSVESIIPETDEFRFGPTFARYTFHSLYSPRAPPPPRRRPPLPSSSSYPSNALSTASSTPRKAAEAVARRVMRIGRSLSSCARGEVETGVGGEAKGEGEEGRRADQEMARREEWEEGGKDDEYLEYVLECKRKREAGGVWMKVWQWVAK